MLKMKQQCERCQQGLPADQTGAYICSFECTFCASCAGDMGQCPNCGGELLPRPSRATELLEKYPPTQLSAEPSVEN
ncbi:MAG: DUF1272 domain-containing protein [Gammaproteobacteria bacterium]